MLSAVAGADLSLSPRHPYGGQLMYTAKPRSVWETVEWRRGRRDGVIDGDVMANQYGSGRDGAG